MARVESITSPVGGWNTRDALADMREDEASTLDNWFPGEGRCTVRPGYASYATGLEGNVETLAEFINGSVRKFLGFANNKIWNISASGAASDITNSMTITNNQWDWACMDGKMALVNGADTPLQIATDGVTASTLTLTGPTAANVIGVNIFNGRSYWWEDDTQDFWYSAVNTLGGTLTQFPLSRVGQFGGKLLCMGTWTMDGGAGLNDFAAYFMTSGETIVYSGSDPSQFSLVGVFRIGAPISQRGVVKLAGDLVAITADGYISLNGALRQARLGDKGVLSEQINPTVTQVAKDYGSNFGWQAFHYPRGNMVIFNVPIASNSTYQQHCFNSNTGKPCRFKGINARCWGSFNDKAYFGHNGIVYVFDDAAFDDAGTNIDADALCASTYLKSRKAQKHVKGLQVVLASDGPVAITSAVDSEFRTPIVPYGTVVFTGGSSTWDVASWDSDAWATGGQLSATITKDWVTRNAFGYAINSRVRVRTKGQLVKWYATNYMFDYAGPT